MIGLVGTWLGSDFIKMRVISWDILDLDTIAAFQAPHTSILSVTLLISQIVQNTTNIVHIQNGTVIISRSRMNVILMVVHQARQYISTCRDMATLFMLFILMARAMMQMVIFNITMSVTWQQG